MNVYDYFEEVSRHQQTQGALTKTSDATGVSHTSIKRLGKEKVDTGGLLFPLKQRGTVSLDAC